MKDERTLIEALKRREPDALSHVFTEHSDKIYRLALRLLNNEQEADGIVQDTFLALIKHIDGFEGRARIGTWLYRIAYNEAMMRIRKAKPYLELSEQDNDHDLPPTCFIAWDMIPDAMVSSAEAREQLENAMARLSPVLRAVFILRDIEELSTRETAESLEISEAAVKVRLHRARLALREQLSEYFNERVIE